MADRPQQLEQGRHRASIVTTHGWEEEPFQQRYVHAHTTSEQDADIQRKAKPALMLAEQGDNLNYAFTWKQCSRDQVLEEMSDGDLLAVFEDGEFRVYEAVVTVKVDGNGDWVADSEHARLERRKTYEKIVDDEVTQ